ncbi:unnamed protein product [Lota lota]
MSSRCGQRTVAGVNIPSLTQDLLRELSMKQGVKRSPAHPEVQRDPQPNQVGVMPKGLRAPEVLSSSLLLPQRWS